MAAASPTTQAIAPSAEQEQDSAVVAGSAEVVEIAADTGGLRIRSSQEVRGVSASTTDDGRIEILISGHHAAEIRSHRFADGWIESVEERSDRGSAMDFVRLILAPRQRVRFRLHTEGDSIWVQLANSRGEWLPIGSGRPIAPVVDSASSTSSGAIGGTAQGADDDAGNVAERAREQGPGDAAGAAPVRLRAIRGVNVRARPTVAPPILGSLKVGQEVLGLERSYGWVRIDFEGREGWVYGQYLEPAR